MNRIEEKNSLISEILNSYDRTDILLLKKLLEFKIKESHYENETSEGNEIYLIKGEIRCCRALARMLNIELEV